LYLRGNILWLQIRNTSPSLDPAVEQALIAFCEQKGLISKKGFMYSAAVNAALAEFFSIAGTEAGNIL
jgi:hypothetical protein